jgi:hypothetical protein
MNRIGFDYWADWKGVAPGEVAEPRPATLGNLISRLAEDKNVPKVKPTEQGECIYQYFEGDVILRGRTLDSPAYKLTLAPRGILRSTFDRNYEALKNMIESHGFKLRRISE